MKVYEVNVYEKGTLTQSTLWSNEMCANIVKEVAERFNGYRADIKVYATMLDFVRDYRNGEDISDGEVLDAIATIDTEDINEWVERLKEMEGDK